MKKLITGLLVFFSLCGFGLCAFSHFYANSMELKAVIISGVIFFFCVGLYSEVNKSPEKIEEERMEKIRKRQRAIDTAEAVGMFGQFMSMCAGGEIPEARSYSGNYSAPGADAIDRKRQANAEAERRAREQYAKDAKFYENQYYYLKKTDPYCRNEATKRAEHRMNWNRRKAQGKW